MKGLTTFLVKFTFSKCHAYKHLSLSKSTSVIQSNYTNFNLTPCNPQMNIDTRSHFYQVDRHDGYGRDQRQKNEIEWIKEKVKGVKAGAKLLPAEIEKFKQEQRDKWRMDRQRIFEDGTFKKEFEFRGADCLDNWIVTSDRTWGEGFSKAELTVSKQNMALFQGHLCCDLPQEGTIRRAGYANIKSAKKRKSFYRDDRFEWNPYTHFIGRMRGDGRTYMITLYIDGELDMTWNDTYNYYLYTRGGPYWQWVKIPFSKFFFGAAGTIQNQQSELSRHYVSAIGFTIMDQNDGPFKLEIDYLGVMKDDNHHDIFQYEQYQTKFDEVYS